MCLSASAEIDFPLYGFGLHKTQSTGLAFGLHYSISKTFVLCAPKEQIKTQTVLQSSGPRVVTTDGYIGANNPIGPSRIKNINRLE